MDEEVQGPHIEHYLLKSSSRQLVQVQRQVEHRRPGFIKEEEELLKGERKKKEQARIAFYTDPFRFVKSLFTQEKMESLRVKRKDLEEYLQQPRA